MRIYEPNVTKNHVGKNWVLRKDNAHHLSRVMRSRVGQILQVFDGKGDIFSAKVLKIDRHEVEVNIIAKLEDKVSAHTGRQVLVVAVCQRQKMSWIIEKATELGVDAIYPVITERVQAFTAKQFDQDALLRYEKVIVSAAMQSGVNLLPSIHLPSALTDLPWGSWQGALLLCEPEGSSIDTQIKKEEKVWFVGPEGGWSEQETAYLKQKNCRGVRIAQHVLRMETAVIVALGVGANMA